jgi:hypothetical protein
MADMVETYRVARSDLNVGDSVRRFGEFVPEAATFPNLYSYLSSGYLEKVWVPNEEMEAHLEKFPLPEAVAVTETPKRKKRVVKRKVKSDGPESGREGGSEATGEDSVGSVEGPDGSDVDEGAEPALAEQRI